MDELTLLWNVLLAVGGGIVTLSAAGAVIVSLVQKAKAPNKEQDERLDTLEADVKEIKERLAQGDHRFEADSAKVETLEREMRATNKIIIQSLQALTAHAIDGNNTEQLKTSEKSLTKFLINKL